MASDRGFSLSIDATVTTLPADRSRNGSAARTTAAGADQIDGDDLLPRLGGDLTEQPAGIGARRGHDRIEAAGSLGQPPVTRTVPARTAWSRLDM